MNTIYCRGKEDRPQDRWIVNNVMMVFGKYDIFLFNKSFKQLPAQKHLKNYDGCLTGDIRWIQERPKRFSVAA